MGKVLLEPGDEFSVSYGRSGKTLKAICLGSRSRRTVLQMMEDANKLGTEGKLVESFDKTIEATKICFPQITDDEIDSITHLSDVILSALGATTLDEDQQKK